MKRVTQKELKAMAAAGAVDLSTATCEQIRALRNFEHLVPVAYARGVYGCIGRAYRGISTGRLYVCIGRTSALFALPY